MYVFKKRGKKKNKYGMIPQNYNRSTNVAMEHNVLALGAVADFGVENRQFTTKADAMHNVELTTKTAIEPNACYRLFYLSNLK